METKNIVLNSSKTLICQDTSNDIFLELDILLLRATPNLNSYLFEESFIDEIINNHEKYAGLPIVADTNKLLSKDYLNLGHNMSPITGKFYSEQIGSYISFSKERGEDGIAELHGKARISKRNSDLIQVLMEMYQTVGLSFSVEVAASDYAIDSNNVLVIGASESNFLFSDALVSFPACPESQALKLVAELNNSLKGGETLINDNTLSQATIDEEGGKQKMEINVNEIVEKNEGLILENEQLKSQLEELKSQVETLNSEKSAVEVSLNESNEAVVSLGKEKEALVTQVEELSTFKSEVIEKENTAKIEAIISEVKNELSEEELTLVNEVAEGKDPEKVQFKINELCAKKYKESLKLNNSKNEESFFALNNQKDLGSDELSKFNM